MPLVNAEPSEPSVCECWIYTPEGGLREVTVENAEATLTVRGRRLTSWCILDQTATGCALLVIYSAEAPSPNLRAAVTRLARERRRSVPWLGVGGSRALAS